MLIFRRKLLFRTEYVAVYQHAEGLHQIAGKIKGVEFVFMRNPQLRIIPARHDFAVERRQQNRIAVI